MEKHNTISMADLELELAKLEARQHMQNCLQEAKELKLTMPVISEHNMSMLTHEDKQELINKTIDFSGNWYEKAILKCGVFAGISGVCPKSVEMIKIAEKSYVLDLAKSIAEYAIEGKIILGDSTVFNKELIDRYNGLIKSYESSDGISYNEARETAEKLEATSFNKIKKYIEAEAEKQVKQKSKKARVTTVETVHFHQKRGELPTHVQAVG